MPVTSSFPSLQSSPFSLTHLETGTKLNQSQQENNQKFPIENFLYPAVPVAVNFDAQKRSYHIDQYA